VKEGGVSEVVGAIILVSIAVLAVGIAVLVLFTGPLPTQIPAFSGLISNSGKTVYISHEGGDPLIVGQFKILVDGVDQTARFTSSLSSGIFSLGMKMNATLPKTPRRVVMISNTSWGGETVLLATDLTRCILQVSPAWYSTDWTYRKRITIDHTKVSGSLTDFPVLISLPSDSTLSSCALPDGHDILFTDAAGTKLPHEIESYTSSTGALVAWVKAPSISSSDNTTLYLYYNNSEAPDQQDATHVWDSNYVGVWHLKEPAGSNSNDSTLNSLTGTPAGSPGQTSGQVDGSLGFSGGNSVSMGNNASFNFGTGAFTASSWVRGGGANQQILGKSNWAGNDNGIQVYTSSSGGYTTAPPVTGTAGITTTGTNSYPAYTNTIGGTSYWNNFYGDYVSAFPVTLPAGTVTSIGVYWLASGGYMRVALYSPGSGKPANLLTQSASTAIVAGWQDVPVTPYYVTGGTYWIVVQTNQIKSFYYITTATGQEYAKAYSGGFDATWNSGSYLLNYQYYMRITYVKIEGYAKATKVTLSDNNASIDSVRFYSHATGNFRLAIYSDSSGPGSKQWESASTAATAGAWNTVSIGTGSPAGLMLNAGTYWLAWQWDSANSGPSYNAGSSGDGNYRAQTYGSYPSSWTGGTSSSEKWSIYLAYTIIQIGSNDGNWHYLAVTRAGTGAGQLVTYYDGVPARTGTDSRTLSNTDSFKLALSNDGLNGFGGYLDEVRISSTARSPDWIRTEYNNQYSPGTFAYLISSEQGTC